MLRLKILCEALAADACFYHTPGPQVSLAIFVFVNEFVNLSNDTDYMADADLEWANVPFQAGSAGRKARRQRKGRSGENRG